MTASVCPALRAAALMASALLSACGGGGDSLNDAGTPQNPVGAETAQSVSANTLVLVGLVVSYASRGSATGVARAHIDAQISLFWSAFWWTIGLWILVAISFVSVVLFLLGFVFLLLLLVLHIWFTVKSVIGLVNLLGDRAP